MYTLQEIDSLEIFVLMDNMSDPFTENEEGIYWNESQYKHGVLEKKEMSGAHCCRACNGLSLLLKIRTGEKYQHLLFDTGPDAGLAIKNAERMHLDLHEVDAIVLSHGHFDHYGGTRSALNAIGKKNLPVYIHPELLLPRAFGDKKNLIYVSDILTREIIEENGGKIIESASPMLILNNTVLISGEVKRATPYEVGLPDEHKLKGNEWLCASDVIDERSIILKIKDKGLCVITGCGHTGVINATHHAINLTNENNIYFIMGGFHLASPEFTSRITPTIKDLKQLNPSYVITGHCTGRMTQALLSEAFCSRHVPYGVGAYFRL